MTEDRYVVNRPLYIFGMVCLICSMALIMFGFFILPRLLWGLHYDVPEFVMEWQYWLQDEGEWTELASDWLILGCFWGPGLILGCLSFWASNRLESQMPELPVQEVVATSRQYSHETWLMFVKVGLVIVFILLIFWILNIWIG